MHKTGALAPVFICAMDYQAKLYTPFSVLGIRCMQDTLIGIDFLPVGEKTKAPENAFADRVCKELRCYLENPAHVFSIPLDPAGTPHQKRVWNALLEIACGKTRSYGELAIELASGAQAVGQACGANPIPVIIPCHRVLGKSGLGGFMKHGSGAPLDIKRWLLAHERR